MKLKIKNMLPSYKVTRDLKLTLEKQLQDLNYKMDYMFKAVMNKEIDDSKYQYEFFKNMPDISEEMRNNHQINNFILQRIKKLCDEIEIKGKFLSKRSDLNSSFRYKVKEMFHLYGEGMTIAFQNHVT